jgi:hypothetical protein
MRILTTGLPDGGRVETVQGIVDRAGPDQTDPPVVRTALDPATFDRDGVATVEVDTSKSVFVRVEILTKEGIPAAFGNPVWLLRDAPAKSIPKDRAV